MIDDQWTNYTIQQPGRKRRAEAACEKCHAKKVKCDLQTQRSHGYEKCSVCRNNGIECQLRKSRRDHGRQDDAQNELQAVQNRPNRSHRSSKGDCTDISHRPRASEDEADHPRSDLDASPQRPSIVSPSEVFDTSHNASLMRSPPIDHASASNIPALSPLMTQHTQASEQSERNMSVYVVDTGYLNIYARENQDDANRQATLITVPTNKSLVRLDLLQSFVETYFEYCYPWCPVLDKSDLFTELENSPLLADSLALAASHIRPPIFEQTTPEQYYDRARRRFYDDEEPDVLVSLRAISLFYWWSRRAPTAIHRHSSWWWTSVVIRHAQQMGIYRQSNASEPQAGMRKRIWWTAFARERLTAICQGKPCIIDPQDCSIDDPNLEDFPPDCDQKKARVFIFWVKLCSIIGHAAKHLAQPASPASVHPGRQLADWINALPEDLQLSIGEERSEKFDKDIHQLHLPYLAVMIVLHLKRSEELLPTISPTAIMAATCIARIYRDILFRGDTRFLMAINCWYCATAFVVLLKASKQENINEFAQEELAILYATIQELQKMWGTAGVFEQGFRRLRENASQVQQENNSDVQQSTAAESDMKWLDYFPFATVLTSPISKILLEQQEHTPYLFADFSDDFLNLQYPDLFETFDQIEMLPTI